MPETPRKKFSQKDMQIVWIPVSNLAVIWQDSQRPFKEGWAKEIADQFDPDKFTPVKTMLPNGHGIHHICDGQHSVSAVRMLYGPNEKVPCLIAPDSDPARAADIFLDTNTNRDHVSKVAIFKVSVTAQRKDEVAINRIVKHCGYRVEGSHNHDTIAAVDGLKFVYNKGKATLDQTLSTIRATWGGDPSAVAAPILRGYGAFLCEFNEQVDFARLREMMLKRYPSPNKLVIDAKGVKELLKCNMTKAVTRLVLKTYNKGLHTNKQLKHKGGDDE